MNRYRNPVPTVDVVIELLDEPGRVVMIERRNPPRGWALPGGFVDYGELVEDAARREADEETGLEVELVALLGVYSKPERDPRLHTLSSVFVGRARGAPRGGDDAARAVAVDPANPPAPVVFDHAEMLADYLRWRAEGAARAPSAGRWLGPDDRAALLRIARASVEAGARRVPPPPLPSPLPRRLERQAACFVTLHTGGELRGCIGTIVPDRPLAENAREMGLAAATRDPRFKPVTASELPELGVEVSVLSVPWRGHPDQVEPGRHGLILSDAAHRGLLLPQVATEHHLDREQFLDAVARKAGMPHGAWRRADATLELFTAQVFGER